MNVATVIESLPSAWTFVYAVAVVAVWTVVSWYLRNQRIRRALEKAILRCQQERSISISDLRRALDTTDEETLARRKRITDLTLEQLRAKLQSDQLSPVDALTAFQWTALEANDRLNCVVRFLPDATDLAKTLEARYKHNAHKPPLYGVPVSIKESIQVAGSSCTLGYVQNLSTVSKEDAVLVAAIKRAGGIPFVLTNVPQSLLSFSCSNPIFGVTANPYDPSRTCGGSSGGEAALISLHGSVVGIGGDVGGSIRVPAHFTGTVGFKPTAGLLSAVGCHGSIEGRPLVCSTPGPMARDVESVVCMMRILLSLDMHRADPYVVPCTFRDDLYNSKTPLTIGYYTKGILPAIPACERAVLQTKAMLEKDGHKLVPFCPPDLVQLTSLYAGACLLDGGKYIRDMLSNDILDSNTVVTYSMYCVPVWVRKLLGKLWPSSRWRTELYLKVCPRTTSELRRIYADIGRYRRRFVKLWQESGLDCLICPVNSCAALPHAYPSKTLPAVAFTVHYNLLNFPAGSVPCTYVTEADEAELNQHYVVDDVFTAKVRSAFSRGSKGLPVGVQCLALPYMDEVCLRLMTMVEKCWATAKESSSA